MAFILALTALFTAWLWTYYINLFIALPSIIGAFVLCKLASATAPDNMLTKVNCSILIASVVMGLLMLTLFLWNN